MRKNMWCLTIWILITSLYINFSSSTHLSANFIMSLFFTALPRNMFIIHLFTEGCTDCFYFLHIRNRVTASTAEHVSAKEGAKPSGHVPRSGVSGSYGRVSLSFLRILHSDYQRIWATCNPSSRKQGFRLPHILFSICCPLFYWFSWPWLE